MRAKQVGEGGCQVRTIGWLIAIVLAIALAFALYRPQVIKTPAVGHEPDDKRPDDSKPHGPS